MRWLAVGGLMCAATIAAAMAPSGSGGGPVKIAIPATPATGAAIDLRNLFPAFPLRTGRLQAPTDTVVCCNRAPAYDFKNTDGQAGSGKGAVIYRPGGIRVGTDKRADALLWHTNYGGWEPSLGVTSDGTVLYAARNSNVDTDLLRSADGGRTWKMVGPAAHRVSLDPFMWVDTTTGRVFNSDLDASVTCPPLSFSDDNGETWTTSTVCGQADHQSITTGPPPDGAAKPSGYPNVAYYCAIGGGAESDTSFVTGCDRSLDGGLNWTPTESPAYPVRQGPGENLPWCDGAAGHGYVGSDGTLYVPRGWCSEPYVAMSRDEGKTFTQVKVSDRLLPTGAHESGVAADNAGNVYYVWVGEDHHPLLAVSRDHGATWSEPMDILPPGVTQMSAFTDSIDVGDPGKLAIVLMGTEQPLDTPAEELTWNTYVVTTADALRSTPTFRAASVNDQKGNPFWKGDCGNLRCGNVGDFLDVVIGPDGTPWAAVVDSCPGDDNACTEFGVGNPRGEAMLAHVVGGPVLRRPVKG